MTWDEWTKVSAVRMAVRVAKKECADGGIERTTSRLESALWLLDELVELHGREHMEAARAGIPMPVPEG